MLVLEVTHKNLRVFRRFQAKDKAIILRQELEDESSN